MSQIGEAAPSVHSENRIELVLTWRNEDRVNTDQDRSEVSTLRR